MKLNKLLGHDHIGNVVGRFSNITTFARVYFQSLPEYTDLQNGIFTPDMDWVLDTFENRPSEPIDTQWVLINLDYESMGHNWCIQSGGAFDYSNNPDGTVTIIYIG